MEKRHLKPYCGKNVREWANELGITYAAMKTRIDKYGWEKAAAKRAKEQQNQTIMAKYDPPVHLLAENPMADDKRNEPYPRIYVYRTREPEALFQIFALEEHDDDPDMLIQTRERFWVDFVVSDEFVERPHQRYLIAMLKSPSQPVPEAQKRLDMMKRALHWYWDYTKWEDSREIEDDS